MWARPSKNVERVKFSAQKNKLKRVFYGLNNVGRVSFFGLEKNMFRGQFQYPNTRLATQNKLSGPPGLVLAVSDLSMISGIYAFHCL